MKVTAIILNSDGRDLKRVLASLAWCGEITIRTAPVNENFTKARNEALREAKNEWVLFVDSDEEVTEELKREILESPRMTTRDGYLISRKDYFFGRWLRFGETGNIKLLRLGLKNAGKWKRRVHERWEMGNMGEVGEMRGGLRHFPHPTIADFIKSINFYSGVDAKEFDYFSYSEVFFKPVGKFVQNYFLKLGFLDGFAGFVHAYMMSWQSLVVRVKQYDLFAAS